MSRNIQRGKRFSRVYSIRCGEKIRISIRFNNEWKYLLWFRISRDGSIYFGLSYKPTTKITTKNIPNAGTAIPLGDDQFDIDEEQNLKDSHISIHGSGRINLANERYKRPSVRDIFELERLFTFAFQHPSKFIKLTKADSGTIDVCINYPINEGRPLFCDVWLSTRREFKEIYFKDTIPDSIQVDAIFNITGFDDNVDRVLQLMLHHKALHQWPEYSYLLIPSGKRRLFHTIRRIFLRIYIYFRDLFERYRK